MRKTIQIALLTGVLLGPCLCVARAQSGSTLYGPSLGLIFDPSRAAIRPILGIPGAATLGAPLSAGFAIGQAAVAPGGDFALVVAKDDFRLAIVQNTAVVQALAPAMGEAPDLVSFSPSGRSAALYYGGSARLLVLSGLRSQTPQAFLADASSLPAAPSLLAVSEDAKSLLLAVPISGTTSLYSLANRLPANRQASPRALAATALNAERPDITPSAHAVAQKIGSFSSVSALRFAGAGLDALVADGADNAAYLIENVSGAAQSSALGSVRDGLSQPVAIEAMDARRVLVANAGASTLTILYRDGTPAVTVPCGCSPVGIHSMSGTSVYRLTEPSQQPMWLLDAGGSEPRIVAVPPDRSQSVQAAAAKGGQQ
jgi:hypothetical protein